jgi:hypothetical protein
MTSQQQAQKTLIPDLRDTRLDRLAELASPVLAHSIALYVPLSSFQAKI